MKVTVDDLEEIMKEIRAGGEEELPPHLKALTVELHNLLRQTPYTPELYEAVIKVAMDNLKQIGGGAEGLLKIIATLAGAATFVIGYRLGIREAGLELGIGTPLEDS